MLLWQGVSILLNEALGLVRDIGGVMCHDEARAAESCRFYDVFV